MNKDNTNKWEHEEIVERVFALTGAVVWLVISVFMVLGGIAMIIYGFEGLIK